MGVLNTYPEHRIGRSKGQRQQLRDDEGRMDGDLWLREHIHGWLLLPSTYSISSPTTCATPGKGIFSEAEYDHPFYRTTQNNIRERRT